MLLLLNHRFRAWFSTGPVIGASVGTGTERSGAGDKDGRRGGPLQLLSAYVISPNQPAPVPSTSPPAPLQHHLPPQLLVHHSGGTQPQKPIS
ncbi:hypothetical protein DPEC_G00214860 [Dallia pectoralis]|uniref:Uncharacterized protein n=1 Tax=Dallia pectoralis TaxID=75939 RepID=A0ACC2G2A0_DALPE|nr:hypothetical protein DPEC_G00214860 [Dallia pectoralis]